MTNNYNEIVALKNNWLYQQVDVEYPTKSSLAGRCIYQSQQVNKLCSLWQEHPLTLSFTDDIFLVDFHRLTIMYALLQASQYKADQRDDIVEFLTQIIYSPPCELYLGFEQGLAVAAAMVTRYDNQVLVSDVVVQPGCQFIGSDEFAAQLIQKLQLSLTSSQIIIEK